MTQGDLRNLHRVLARRPLGLAFDIDGTLSELVATPDEARLYTGTKKLLAEMRDRAGVHVAIMTGRGIDDGAKMVNVEGLTYIGTHGLEWSDGLPDTHEVKLVPGAEKYVAPGQHVLDIAARELRAMPEIVVQRKYVGGTLHYRRSPDGEVARRRILAAVEQPTRDAGMRIGEGKKVVEILAPLHVDKGQALRRFVERFALQGVIFAGDDLTDVNAMLEIERLQQEGMAALGVAVQHPDTLPGLLEHADMVVQGVPGMMALMREMLQML